jgi:redox-sensitive bicupin YhaK (pirin superfamily)
MADNIIKSTKPLGFQWETNNPFLFCVHHKDAYPRGNEKLGPQASLEGRSIGHDFVLRDGWRMYHGQEIPGFPVHPHRGFETVTIVLEGLVDHADSLGAAGRYGHGDVQWMTAGAGIQHTEMFPLLNKDRDNPLELFQIWLNLPAADKFVDPHYKMLWREEIPRFVINGKESKKTEVIVIAGSFNGTKAVAPPPDSWASKEENEVGIWLLKMDPEAEIVLPETMSEITRSVYFYNGGSIILAGQEVNNYTAIDVKPDQEVSIKNGKDESNLLVLQGRPIGEPVVQYGPFVMNSAVEIQQAIDDYRKTEFGGWPWPRPDQVHDPGKQRFARYADGQVEERE